MKAIGNIYLAWRIGRGTRRIIVGVIKKNATLGNYFTYIENGVEEARKLGFSSYEGFPDLEKEYTKNVIKIFGSRFDAPVHYIFLEYAEGGELFDRIGKKII